MQKSVRLTQCARFNFLKIQCALSFGTMAFMLVSPFSTHVRVSYVLRRLLLSCPIPASFNEVMDTWFSLPGQTEGIYAWINLAGNDLYVGSTTQPTFRHRWQQEYSSARARLGTNLLVLYA